MDWLASIDWRVVGQVALLVCAAAVGFVVAWARKRQEGDEQAAWSLIKELAGSVIALVTAESKLYLRSVTKAEVYAVAKIVYEHTSFPEVLRKYVALDAFQIYTWQLWLRFLSVATDTQEDAETVVQAMRARGY